MNRKFWTIFEPRTKAYAFAEPDDGDDDDGDGDGEDNPPPPNPPQPQDTNNWQQQLRQVRREAADYRTRLRAKETELTSAQQELEQLRAEKRDRIISEAVTAEAKKHGAIEPDILHRLGTWELDDKGSVKDLEAGVKALKEKHPKLFVAVNGADGGAGKGSPPKGESFSDRLKEAARR